MITGLNTDVEYQGKTYHVQTEDTGRNHPTIVTILFYSGAILSSRKTSYADIVKAENLQVILKEMMSEQHKEMIRDLQAGRIHLPGTRPEAKPVPSPAAPAAPESKPPSRPAESKGRGTPNLDDMILDYLSAREERKKP